MSPGAAQNAGQPGDRVAIGAMVKHGKCIQQYVLIATLNAKFRFNPEKTDQFIAATVTQK